MMSHFVSYCSQYTNIPLVRKIWNVQEFDCCEGN